MKQATHTHHFNLYGAIMGVIRACRFVWEFINAFVVFSNIGPTITVYGSARLGENDRYYQTGVSVGSALAKAGYAVMTGGGPGIMEAANKGARLAGGSSYGASIVIPNEQRFNQYLDKHHAFKYFFTRKFALTRFSSGFIALPGGYGTLDEIFEMATLVKTEKIDHFPIVLIGVSFWKPMLDYLAEQYIPLGTLHEKELQCFYLTDSVDDAIDYIQKRVSILHANKSTA